MLLNFFCHHQVGQIKSSVPSGSLQGAESPPLLLNSPIFGAPAEAPSSEELQIQLLRKQLQQQEQQALAASAQVCADFTVWNTRHWPRSPLWCRKTRKISPYCFPPYSFCGCHSYRETQVESTCTETVAAGRFIRASAGWKRWKMTNTESTCAQNPEYGSEHRHGNELTVEYYVLGPICGIRNKTSSSSTPGVDVNSSFVSLFTPFFLSVLDS